MFKCIYCLVNYGVVLLLGVVSLMAGSTTGVLMSLVWWKPNRNAAAFLHNLRNDQFLHRSLQVLHHKSTGVLYHNLRCPEPLHRRPEVLLCPELLHHQGDRVLHDYAFCPILLDRSSQVLLFSATYCTDFPKYCYTETPAHYSTKTVEYYTEVLFCPDLHNHN
jgi:hypothetical protein